MKASCDSVAHRASASVHGPAGGLWNESGNANAAGNAHRAEQWRI